MNNMKKQKSTIGLALILMSLVLLPMASILAETGAGTTGDKLINTRSGAGTTGDQLIGNTNFIENRPLFQGQGFVLNGDQDQGYRVDLALLKADADEISGKMTIGHSGFKIGGTFKSQIESQDVRVEFELTSRETGEIQGSFSGVIEKFDRFKLLRGVVTDFEGQTWELTAMSNSRGIISVKLGQEKKSHYAGTKDILAVQGQGTVEDQLFIRPIKIKAKKFLGFIPTGKKEVELEITQGNKTFKRKITERNEVFIDKYSVSVGSLLDEENIEISLKSTN
jgi:hypothetical protein